MPKCVYCGQMYSIPKGLTLIMKDGTINYLCSSKCRKNMLMKRRKVRWVTKKRKGEEVSSGFKNSTYKRKTNKKK
jgi:large subunit ribosomal protein L24e